MDEKKEEGRNKIRVCVNENCCQRGSREIFANLEQRFEQGISETEVVSSPDCFRFCKKGANVSVNGNVIHWVRPSDAVRRVEQELRRPSRKIDGLGTRSIDELDDVLEGLF